MAFTYLTKALKSTRNYFMFNLFAFFLNINPFSLFHHCINQKKWCNKSKPLIMNLNQ